MGRRDGIVTSAAEANRDLPPPFANFNTLSTLFNGKGLSDKDMVILSGTYLAPLDWPSPVLAIVVLVQFIH